MAEPRWLTDEQQRSWRAYVTGTARFVEALDRAHDQGIPLALGEYHLLVQLSDRADRTVRMSDLAEGLVLSRSRLTHTVDRMEKRGLVVREPVPGDRRGVNCVMTDAGWEALVESAPLHVAAVRRLMVDVLDDDELTMLGHAMAKVAQEAKTPAE
ncbi:MAG: MarR family transcriptional regulator [Promicromonosporaceae bacterium]|nr:MarR family transcriptional regulator [Promicromonosporaceae bacterium]